MKHKLKYIGIFICIGLLTVTFVNSQKLGSVAIAAKNQIVKGISNRNAEGLNPYRHYDYVEFGSLKELSSASDAVIKGEVINVHSPEVMVTATFTHGDVSEPLKDVYTVSEVKVIEAIKGSYKPGDVIQVRQMGGIYKDVEYPSNHPEMYTQNMQGIFFLKLSDNNGLADTINPRQGFVKLVNDKVDNSISKPAKHFLLGNSYGYDSSLFENGIAQKDLVESIIKN